MVTSLEQEVAELLDGQHLADPWPVWNRLREEAPVFARDDMVILTSYANVKAMLPDKEHYSNKIFTTGSRAEAINATFSPEVQALWRDVANSESNMELSGKSQADHDRLRGIAHRFFTPRQVQQMEAEIQDFWDGLLAEAAEQEVYDQKRIAQNLALRVMTNIVGCPDVDGPYIFSLVQRSSHFLGGSDEDLVRDACLAHQEFNEYIQGEIIAGYHRHPDSNAFVRAMMDAKGEDNLSPMELCGMVSVVLFGGLGTTSVLLSTGLLTLLQHRDQWEWVCEDPVARVPGAVEELFRYVSPAQFLVRNAIVDFEIDGVPVPKGQTVIGVVAAAHRDPAEYENPDTFDVTHGPRRHLGLGFGPKFCLGAGVIRAEARTVFTSLAERYPDLQLAIDPSDLDWTAHPVPLRGLRELPIALGSPRHE